MHRDSVANVLEKIAAEAGKYSVAESVDAKTRRPLPGGRSEVTVRFSQSVTDQFLGKHVKQLMLAPYLELSAAKEREETTAARGSQGAKRQGLDVEKYPHITFKSTKLVLLARAGFVATTKINRHDFGVSWNSVLDKGGVIVGNMVDISIDVEALLEKLSWTTIGAQRLATLADARRAPQPMRRHVLWNASVD